MNKYSKRFDLEQLRKVDFTPLLDAKLITCGDKRRTLCPFHNETTPSFFVYPNNSYYCFGCGTHGNAIDFVMKKFGYSFIEACEILEDL